MDCPHCLGIECAGTVVVTRVRDGHVRDECVEGADRLVEVSGIELRPALLRFAVEMEQKLRENDYRGGWEDCDLEWLWRRCQDELRELDHALLSGDPRCIVREAADVANFAMMIADNVRRAPGGGLGGAVRGA